MRKLDLIRAFAPRINEAVSPEQVLRRYVPGFTVRNGFAVCIAHKEDTASMRVGPRYAHCFGCGFHGDALEITKRLLHFDAFTALVTLNADFALDLPLGRAITLRESLEIKERSERLARDRARIKEDRLAQLERKLDLEQEFFFLEDLRKEFQPTEPDAPFHPIWRYGVRRSEQVRYLLKCED